MFADKHHFTLQVQIRFLSGIFLNFILVFAMTAGFFLWMTLVADLYLYLFPILLIAPCFTSKSICTDLFWV